MARSITGWRRWLVVLAGLAGVIVLLRVTLFRPRPVEVEVVAAARGVVEDVVTNSQAGTVRSRRRSKLGAERAGRVVAIPRREGAPVRAGDPLVLLDTSTAQRQLELARRDLEAAGGSLAAARAAARLADSNFERIERLHAERVVSERDFDEARSGRDRARAELSAAEAGLARARAAVRLAEDDLAHLAVTAPFAGVVAQRLVEVGESVVPGQPVIEIVAPDSLYVSARIDEIDIGRLAAGLPARVTLDPYRGETWRGVVAKVFPVVDERLEQNRTLEVEVDLRNDPAKPRPRPGISADVIIVVDQRDSVLRVPTFAVIEGRRVLVAENGRAVSREVATGVRNWEWTEIKEGLAPGDRVITSLDRKGVAEGAAVTAKPAAGGTGGVASAGR